MSWVPGQEVDMRVAPQGDSDLMSYLLTTHKTCPGSQPVLASLTHADRYFLGVGVCDREARTLDPAWFLLLHVVNEAGALIFNAAEPPTAMAHSRLDVHEDECFQP